MCGAITCRASCVVAKGATSAIAVAAAAADLVGMGGGLFKGARAGGGRMDGCVGERGRAQCCRQAGRLASKQTFYNITINRTWQELAT